MSFKLKAAVAAVAMVASMSASAAMTTSASGDSSLVLTLLDTSNNISATFDLGYTYSTFQAALVTTPGTSITWDLASNPNYSAAWTTFSTTANLAGANTNWAVFAGDASGSGAGSRGMITTVASGSTALTQSQLNTSILNFDSYIQANNIVGTHATAEDGASTSTSTNSFAKQAIAYGTVRKVNNSGSMIQMRGFNTSMGVVNLKYVGTNLLANNAVTTYGNQYGASTFSMSSAGILTYTNAAAPVPEADSWAMLLAGLGMMGFIARRRISA